MPGNTPGKAYNGTNAIVQVVMVGLARHALTQFCFARQPGTDGSDTAVEDDRGPHYGFTRLSIQRT